MSEASDELFRALVALALAKARSAQVRTVRPKMVGANERMWSDCLLRLDEHRLMPLVYFGLKEADLREALPRNIETLLRAQFEYSDATNLMRWVSLQGLTAQLRAVSITPTVCKGTVLSRRYYPHPATRFMNDIDLWVTEQERPVVEKVLLNLGFSAMPTHGLPDGGSYRNPVGIIVDLHHRMRIFEGRAFEGSNLVEEFEPNSFRVHEPHALLVHLHAHYMGHVKETGPILAWLIDLGLVLDKQRERLDFSRLQTLLSAVTDWQDFLQCLGLLRQSFGVELPPAIASQVQGVAPLRLDALLRQRRLALWGLPTPRGWARLLVSAIRGPTTLDRPLPSRSDLLRWPMDLAKLHFGRRGRSIFKRPKVH